MHFSLIKLECFMTTLYAFMCTINKNMDLNINMTFMVLAHYACITTSIQNIPVCQRLTKNYISLPESIEQDLQQQDFFFFCFLFFFFAMPTAYGTSRAGIKPVPHGDLSTAITTLDPTHLSRKGPVQQDYSRCFSKCHSAFLCCQLRA